MINLKEQLIQDIRNNLKQNREEVMRNTIVLKTVEPFDVDEEGKVLNENTGNYEMTEDEIISIISSMFNDDLEGNFPNLPRTKILGWEVFKYEETI